MMLSSYFTCIEHLQDWPLMLLATCKVIGPLALVCFLFGNSFTSGLMSEDKHEEVFTFEISPFNV